jgi:PAS domain-containing protein
MNFLDYDPEVAVIYSRDWHLIYANKAWEVQNKFVFEELAGKHILELNSRLRNTPLWERFCKAMESPTPSSFSSQIPGTNEWVLYSFYPTSDSMLIRRRDITAVKIAEQQREAHERAITALNAQLRQHLDVKCTMLQKQSEFTSHLVRESADGIMALDNCMECFVWNHIMEEKTSMPASAMIGFGINGKCYEDSRGCAEIAEYNSRPCAHEWPL